MINLNLNLNQMKIRNIIFPVLMFFAFVAVSGAQTSSNTTTDVTANLRKGLTITKNADLSFGDVQMAADNSATSTVTPGNGARFTVTGNNATVVTITLSNATLNLGTPTVSVSSWDMQVTDATPFVSGTNILTGTTGNTTLSATGQKVLWLGGTLTATTSATPGMKTGTLTVTVTY